MNIRFEKTQNSLLSDYIEGYYFLKNTEEDFSLTYLTFPNNYQIVSILLNSSIRVEKDHINVISNSNISFISNFTYNYTTPLQVNYRGAVNELTIYFKPLGLNFFVSDLQKYYACKENFVNFLPFDDFEAFMTTLLNKDDLDLCIKELETYLIGKLQNVNLKLVEKIKNDIIFKNIAEIAAENGLSRQYINKLFHSHLGKSPTEFKRIHRFRTTLEHPHLNLTQKGLDALFYDQSHLIREFHKITHTSPKAFFDKIDFKTSNPWLII